MHSHSPHTSPLPHRVSLLVVLLYIIGIASLYVTAVTVLVALAIIGSALLGVL